MKPFLPPLVFLIVAAVLVAAVFGLTRREPAVSQPIAFNHKIHIEDVGLACLDCHTGAATKVHAGIPGREFCADCHDPSDEPEADSALASLVPFLADEREIPWKRVAVVPPDVFFSHRRHVTSGALECKRCHPGQSERTAPPRFARKVMSMNDCLECHRKSQVSVDCLACHR